MLPENTVCLSRTASVGFVVVMGRPMATSQDFVNWVCSPELDHRFLKYVLLSEQSAFMRFASGTTHQTIYFPEVKAFHICLPPPSEQDAIGHILQTLDDKIEMNRRMDETLEVMARALYKSWFVDFDPVRAKMEGHDPELPKDISDLFPDQLVPSDHGQIPQGWRNGRIHDVASLNPESWSAKHQPADLAYVDLTNAKWGYIERVDTFRWGDAPSRARRVLRKGDTIIATVRPGNGSFALIDEDGLTGSTGFAVLRPRRAVDREFVWCACTALENIDRLALLADGGAYPAIRPEEVISTPVVLGDIATRVAFSRLAGSLLDKIETNKRESRCLAVLRETLLPKLISGKVRLKPAENSAGKIA